MDEYLNQLEISRRISGKSISELIRETGTSRSSVCTVLGKKVNGSKHSPSFKTLLKVADAVGARVRIEMPKVIDQ